MSYWDLVEPIWEEVSIYDGPEVFLQQYNSAPEKSRILLAAHWCQSEIGNGGFTQFFGNSTGVLAPEAAIAFRAIGMPKTAEVVERAMAWFGTPYPRERSVREDALEACWETQDEDADDPLSALDDEFYAFFEEENGGFESAADSYASE